MHNQRCGSCRLSVNFSQAYTVANAAWHTDCFKCSLCNRQLTAQPHHPEGRTVKATVEDTPILYCSDCAVGGCEERGLVLDPHHTLAGPANSFGLKSTTTVATATFSKPLWKNDVSHSGKAVPSGVSNQIPKQCTACGSPNWLVYGFERSKCGECGNIF